MANSSKKNPSISIIIPTKDRNLILINHLKYLSEALRDVSAEIIIVNDSKKNLEELPKIDDLAIVKNPKNGVASARNYGAHLARSPLLLFLDDDMIIHNSNIKAIFLFHAKNKNCFLNLNWQYPKEINEKLNQSTFGRYLIKFGFNSLKGWNNGNKRWSDEEVFATHGITSQNLSVPKNLFFEIGGYNECFPYAGFEDFELSQRIKQANYSIFIDPLEMTYHDEKDRLRLTNWLARKYRGGISRRVAVKLGHNEYKLSAGIIKKTLLILFVPFLDQIAQFTTFVFRSTNFDKVSFFVINLLLALANYGGYFSFEADKILQKLDENQTHLHRLRRQ